LSILSVIFIVYASFLFTFNFTLQYLRGESQIKRAVTVLKTRASMHEPEIRQYTISEKGIVVGEPFTEGQSVF